MKRLIHDWNEKLRAHDVQCERLQDGQIQAGVFLVPRSALQVAEVPSLLGQVDHDQFFEWLGKQQRSGDTLSLNGFIGEEDRRVEVPDQRYDEELKLDNGISTISRLSGMPAPRLQNGLYLRLR